jgi:hypothetical protein
MRPSGRESSAEITGAPCTNIMLDAAERLLYTLTTGEPFPFQAIEQTDKPKRKRKS